MQVASISSGRVRLSDPRNDFANGVRTVATITAFLILRLIFAVRFPDASTEGVPTCQERPQSHLHNRFQSNLVGRSVPAAPQASGNRLCELFDREKEASRKGEPELIQSQTTA